jgi:DNA-binding MarR family transcriptional regulator
MRKIEMRSAPGHLIRRAQQANSAVWAREVGDDITSLQFAVLNCLWQEKNVDQTTLGRCIATDRSTTADVVARMVRRRLIRQVRDAKDSRRNILKLTTAGLRALEKVIPKVVEAGSNLVAPLTSAERRELGRLLTKLISGLEATDRKRGNNAGKLGA